MGGEHISPVDISTRQAGSTDILQRCPYLSKPREPSDTQSTTPCGLPLTHVDLMVIQRSCSSLRVSVKRVSPARAEAMMPALHTRESVSVDLPWSTWAMTDMFRMLAFLSMMARI